MGWRKFAQNLTTTGDIWAQNRVYVGSTQDVYLQRTSATIISTPTGMSVQGGSSLITQSSSGTVILNNSGEIVVGFGGGSQRLYVRATGTTYMIPLQAVP